VTQGASDAAPTVSARKAEPVTSDSPIRAIVLWEQPVIRILPRVESADADDWLRSLALDPDLREVLETRERSLAKRRAKRATKKAYEARQLAEMETRHKAAALPKGLTAAFPAKPKAGRTTVPGARPPIPREAFS
jgi:hypothetical protein